MRFFLLFIFTIFSLPALADLQIVHCLKGCPTGAPATNTTVVREIYALSNNATTKFADWVAYRVTNLTIGSSDSLNRAWKADPLLDGDETLEPEDYKGANKALKVDRGHQAPLASFAGTIYWRDTNYLSNITPQKADLNQKAWMYLESAVRHAAYHLNQVWVLTGPLYEDNETPLPQADEHHKIPSGYWKLVMSKSGKMAGFIFDQDTPKGADYCDTKYEASLSDIDTKTSLDIAPDAPASWPTGSLRKDLGC